ncbi:unnamed protein product [Hyaloperonospora brassicae]|uniref:ABC transmembrane type-1 domain-containing protein n=1 Tax=Hyaloperonospora brassicae TaxID=162125 RepID=A0AAV0TTT9_HYABA|nr:unnamed protein product [Hyaloperonospora brassicae]
MTSITPPGLDGARIWKMSAPEWKFLLAGSLGAIVNAAVFPVQGVLLVNVNVLFLNVNYTKGQMMDEARWWALGFVSLGCMLTVVRSNRVHSNGRFIQYEKALNTIYVSYWSVSKEAAVKIGVIGGMAFAISQGAITFATGMAAQGATDGFKAIRSARRVVKAIDRKPLIDATSGTGRSLDHVTGNIVFRDAEFAYPAHPDAKIYKNSPTTSDSASLLRREEPCSTREEIIVAAKQANAFDVISNISKGVDTDVGDRGAQVLGGQKHDDQLKSS